ncbi:MAG: hypothetical protein ACREOZ_03290, partial [Gloeomargaritales cyanobacterium]
MLSCPKPHANQEHDQSTNTRQSSTPTPPTRTERYHQLRTITPTSNRQSSRLPTRKEDFYAINQQASDDDSGTSENLFAVRGTGATPTQQNENPKSNHAVVLVKVVSPNHPTRLCHALLDSGATSSLINSCLTHPEDTTQQDRPTHWVTKGGDFYTTHTANINFHFLDLNSKQQINGVFHVDKEAPQHSGGYDFIIGFDLMEMIGIDLLIPERLIKWGDYTTPMNATTTRKNNNNTMNITTTHTNISSTDLTEAHTQQRTVIPVITSTARDDERDLTPAMQKALRQQGTGMISSNYDKHNYASMVKNCTHLSDDQQAIILKLFKQHAQIFSGRVGTFPGPPYHINLKKDARPYTARPYTIPRALEIIVKKELQRLVDIDVLKPNVKSAWGSPTFAIPKKDGRVRIITDFRVLNTLTERQPHPITKFNDIIQRMEGFTFDTCLDLNMGYDHVGVRATSSNFA